MQEIEVRRGRYSGPVLERIMLMTAIVVSSDGKWWRGVRRDSTLALVRTTLSTTANQAAGDLWINAAMKRNEGNRVWISNCSEWIH